MKENDIRPQKVFNRYLELSRLDGAKLNKSSFEKVNCVACDSNAKHRFKKDGFDFLECEKCNTLFCSPRPTESQLDSLYFNSESSYYWSNIFFPQVENVRREKLFRPKAQKIADLIKQQLKSVKSVCDVGAGHGLLLKELKEVISKLDIYALEPDSTSAQECRQKGITVLEEVSGNAKLWRNKFDLTLSFEVIEHVHSPKNFIRSLYDITAPEGYTLITGLGYEGFDILSLQSKSKAISPPHHLNFLSIDGFKKIFEYAGFKQITIWTPGQLDVDIAINSLPADPFLLALKRRGECAIADFQNFLVKHNLSSHVWVLAQK